VELTGPPTLGILGGVFDPPHLGHVAIARAAIAHFELDRLLVLVVADPGHKLATTSSEVRLELAKLAFADVSEAEVALDRHSRTVDSLEEMEPSDAVFVIGAPYGIGHTLSIGHLSARYRPNTVDSDMALAELLQTDAAINPGNSGGPMFNMAGEVIGVASHNITRSGGFEGLGFVVTINMARRLLLEEPSFWSGLAGVMLTGNLARALNLPQAEGVLVQQVAVNSPAARMGLRPGTIPATVDGRNLLLGGDVILSVLGVPIGQESYAKRRERVSQVPPGSPVTVTVLRDGQPVILSRIR